MGKDHEYILDEEAPPPSPPVDILHLRHKHGLSEFGKDDDADDVDDKSPADLGRNLEELQQIEEDVDSELIQGYNVGDENFTFVKYDTPIRAQKQKHVHMEFKESEMFQVHRMDLKFTFMSPHGKLKCTEMPWNDSLKKELLDLIRTPNKFHYKGGAPWQKKMSLTPVSCSEVEDLHNSLNHLLLQRQAKDRGICPIRRAIYEDFFDELHRQIVTESPERGVLLLRCRLEMAHTIQVMSHLEAGSYAYIMRQTAMENGGNKILLKQLKTAREERDMLRKIYEDLVKSLQEDQERLAAQVAEETARDKEELEFLRMTETRLKNVLNRFMNLRTALKEVTAVKNADKSDGLGVELRKKSTSGKRMTSTKASGSHEGG